MVGWSQLVGLHLDLVYLMPSGLLHCCITRELALKTITLVRPLTINQPIISIRARATQSYLSKYSGAEHCSVDVLFRED
jgi:hypothetical protein